MVDQRQVARDFDEIVVDYNKQIQGAITFSGMEHQLFIDGKARWIETLARAHFPDLRSVAVLDVGCGVGNYLGALEGRFRSMTGLDVSAESIAYARERHPDATCLAYEGGRMPLADCSVDLAFAVCVMHHVPSADWPDFIAEMHRVLRPGGLALVFEHNPLNPATQYVVRSCDIDKDAVLLWPRQVRRLFQRGGFQLFGSRTIFSLPPIGGALRRVDQWLGVFPFGAQYYVAAVRTGSKPSPRGEQ